jgi:hypothetical protein
MAQCGFPCCEKSRRQRRSYSARLQAGIVHVCACPPEGVRYKKCYAETLLSAGSDSDPTLDLLSVKS